MEILYKVHNNLYVNLTNKCSSACTFCLRQNRDTVGESGSLWLEREPSADEVKAEFSKWDMDKLDEVCRGCHDRSSGFCEENLWQENPA
jgi:2-iminoacetate synthase ThiH